MNRPIIMKVGGQARQGGGGCCGPGAVDEKRALPGPERERAKPEWAVGILETPAGAVFKAATGWSWSDRWGQIKSRAGAFRMKYSVGPGLYAVGDPGSDADVFVSANYKLSFDILRRALKGMHAWILVLDTRSINVWCAAGKRTFGTDELVRRICEARLDAVVSHRRIIVPQLGAVGVNAREVRKKTGFRVYFGPVHARDIPAYVGAGYKKSEEMSTVRFAMTDRLILTPMELNPALKKFPLYALIVLLAFGLQPSGIIFKDAWSGGLPFLLLGLASITAGAFVTPVLLPYVPFRSFAVKGWIVGVLFTALSIQAFGILDKESAMLLVISYLFFPLASSYLALQFTGSTTFTGMSGVKRELKIAVPIYMAATALSLILLIVFKLVEWRVL